MRTLTAAILVSFMGLSAGAQTTDKPVVLKVSGMSCGVCAKTVEKEARKIDGVKAAKVSQPKGEAEITYDPAKTSPRGDSQEDQRQDRVQGGGSEDRRQEVTARVR